MFKRTESPSKARGAVPKARPVRERRRLPLAGPLMLVVLLGGVGYAVVQLGGAVSEHLLQRPVEQVQVEGPFEYVSREEATALIGRAIDNEFVGLDLGQLKKVIESHSWIERAVVERRWPDALRVKIVEQVPIARWGDHGFLNQRGEVMATEQGKRLEGLPWLHGREAESERIMARYQDVSARLRSRNLVLTRFWRDEQGTWRLTLDGGAQLVLGQDEVLNKLQRFLRVFDDYLADKLAVIDRVDMRYSNGLAVAWREEYEVTIQQAERNGA